MIEYPQVRGWYCVHTKAKCEHLAASSIRSLPEVDVYCPRIRFQRNTTRGKVWFVEALFPGYVFANFMPLDSIRGVRHSQNVVRVLEFGGHLVAVPPQIIADLRQQMQDSELREIPPNLVRVGDTVELSEGPMRGLTGIVERRLTGAERVRVLLDFLGSHRLVEVDTDKLLVEGSPDLRVKAAPRVDLAK